MRGRASETPPRGLLAAQHRVTPLSPRLCILRSGRWLTAVTDCGFGIATFDGRRMYGDTADPLRAPSGVKLWVAEPGRRRFYVTAMPDYAGAEREYMAGRRRVSLREEEAEFYARREELTLTVRVTAEDEGERRQVVLQNRGDRPREVALCAVAEAPSPALQLALSPLPEGVVFTGGARLRMRCPLLLPAGGEWRGELTLLTGGAQASEPPPAVYEPELPPERVQLGARLYPLRTTGAFVAAVEETAAQPPEIAELPERPFIRLTLRSEQELARLQAYLTRLARWEREGIPTGLTVAAEPSLRWRGEAMTRAFPTVPVRFADVEREPAVFRALCFWDGAKEGRLPAAVAVAYTPLTLRALSGGGVRRSPRLPAMPGICPGSEWLLLKRDGVLYSLLHADREENYTLPDGLRVTVKGKVTADSRRFEVVCTSRASRPETVSLAYYAEPRFTADPVWDPLTLSHWEQETGVLHLTHPLCPGRAVTLTVLGGADSFDCDRAAFWCGDWGGRRPCPLRFPGASVTRICRLPPRRQERVVFEVETE